MSCLPGSFLPWLVWNGSQKRQLECRTRRFTEWRPGAAAGQFRSRSGAAIDELNVKPLMKTPFRSLVMFGFAFAAIVQVHSQGYIVPNGVTYSTAGLSAVIHVLQNPTNSDYTGFILRPRFKTPPSAYYTIFSFDPAVSDEGVRTFFVSPNDPISLQPIQANSYNELVLGNLYGFDPDVPFYLGFYTGYTNGTSAGVYSSPVFGWGRFVNNQGVIEMLDAALAMEAAGIYVGTQTIIPVPEPGVLGFCAIEQVSVLTIDTSGA